MPVHVCVCICTYKRPTLLRDLLSAVVDQCTNGEFTFSVVVADNDVLETARCVVEDVRARESVPMIYAVEPEQNIARARNKAIESSIGDYLAFIDDDEVPGCEWLLSGLRGCIKYESDGVLGPVRPRYVERPPDWVVRGGFFERPEYVSGRALRWRETRTGNVFVKRSAVVALGEPFRPTFGNGGEDQDFFRRLMETGHVFAWCNEAAVVEYVPPERCTRRYLLQRALQRGQCERNLTDWRGIAKSLVAVPVYAVLLPFTLVAGHYRFMKCAVRLCDHSGKLLGVMGMRPTGNNYVQGWVHEKT